MSGTPPPPPPPSRMSKVSAALLVATGLLTAAGGFVAASGGYVEKIFDWAVSTDRTQSQVTALDERLKLMESEKHGIERDRTEMSRISRDLQEAVDDLRRTGADVSRLSELQREVELKVERLDAILEILRDKKGSRR